MVDASPLLARRLAADLLFIGAVHLSPDAPFTWASGLRSPVYCDNRLTLGYPAVRRAVTEGFAAHLEAAAWRPEVVAGTATAGIPHAAWLAERLELPMVYVRARPKEHGRGNQVEGRLEEGQRVVVVEDLISTGRSSLGAVEGLRAAGAEVVGLVAIFSYGFPEAEEAFRQARVPVHTLTDFPTLVSVAEGSGSLSAEALASLEAWRVDPAAWSERALP